MRKSFSNSAFFVAAICFGIASVISFCTNEISTGICYIGLALAFISLGFRSKKQS